MACLALTSLLLGWLVAVEAFNYPASVPVWCGKAYLPTNASFQPGGELYAPQKGSKPLLDLRFRPRMSLYTSGETSGSFIVDAPISYALGEPYQNVTYPSDGSNNTGYFTTLYIDISDADSGQSLVGGRNVSVGSTSNELEFSLEHLTPRTAPYKIQLEAASVDGVQSYTKVTELYHLPAKTDGSSIARIDNLYQGLLVRNGDAKDFSPIFPYSFYASWSGYFENKPQNVQVFKDMGFNIVHVIPDASVPEGFNFTEFDQFLSATDEAGLWVMYDMRWTYMNLTSVAYQVEKVKSHPSLLLWYTADEPDGQVDPLNSTTLAYNAVKSVDPYHPVSLVLNCANFYYKEYTSTGTDIVMEDVYPIGINATHSVRFNTPCNSTYGDCGCDDCVGDFEDISNRLDDLAKYQEWIGGSPKPLWGVPQAFGGSEYWSRNPTQGEEIVMNALSINHGAKGLVAWTFPTEQDLEDIMGRFAKVVTGSDVTEYLLGAPTQALKTSGVDRLDVAGWKVGGQMLVSVAFLQYDDIGQQVTVELPDGIKASSVGSTLWGESGWTASDGKLVKQGLKGLETDFLLVPLA